MVEKVATSFLVGSVVVDGIEVAGEGEGELFVDPGFVADLLDAGDAAFIGSEGGLFEEAGGVEPGDGGGFFVDAGVVGGALVGLVVAIEVVGDDDIHGAGGDEGFVAGLVGRVVAKQLGAGAGGVDFAFDADLVGDVALGWGR